MNRCWYCGKSVSGGVCEGPHADFALGDRRCKGQVTGVTRPGTYPGGEPQPARQRTEAGRLWRQANPERVRHYREVRAAREREQREAKALVTAAVAAAIKQAEREQWRAALRAERAANNRPTMTEAEERAWTQMAKSGRLARYTNNRGWQAVAADTAYRQELARRAEGVA